MLCSIWVLLPVMGTIVAIVVALLGFRLFFANNEWEERSSSFVDAVHTVGMTLEPGQVADIEVAECQADELVLLPLYCSQDELKRCFRGEQSNLQAQLFALSREMRTPALVWIGSGKVLSINHIDFKFAVNLSVKRWDLRLSRKIKIGKEKESPNGFLSIYFP